MSQRLGPFVEVSSNRCFAGVQMVLRHMSKALSCQMNVGVYLPDAALSGQHLPVVYFLSGLSCTEQNFITKAGSQRIASELGVIVVAPDTSPRGEGVFDDPAYDLGCGAGFYVNATAEPWAKHYRMEDYITDELPGLLEAHLPVSDRRGILGHSMGGHGALTLFLRHSGRYRSVSALAPIVAPSKVPWGHKAFSAYFGKESGPEIWEQHDACALVLRGQGNGAHFLIDQGEADSFLVEQLRPELFEAACETAGAKLTLRRHQGFDHSYYFVATFLEDHLRHHAKILAALH